MLWLLGWLAFGVVAARLYYLTCAREITVEETVMLMAALLSGPIGLVGIGIWYVAEHGEDVLWRKRR